jgi:hypothetical protein
MGKPLTVILTAATVGVLVEEAKAMLPWLSDRMILRVALRLLPFDRRERYLEEWAGHLAEIPGPISKLIFTLCLSLALLRIRYYFWSESKRVKPATSPHASLYRLALFMLIALAIQVRLRKIIEWFGFSRPRTKILGIDYEIFAAIVLVAIIFLRQMPPQLPSE